MFSVEWWNTLSIATQIFYCVAIPATMVLIVQTLLMFLGLGDDGDMDDLPDASLDSDATDGIFGENTVTEPHDSFGLEGLRVFTVRGIVAFFVVFGWVGVVMDSAGASLWATVPVAFVCGASMMVLLAFLMRAILRMRSDGNADNRNAIGTAGKVHLTIPPSRTGEGKVHVMLQGAYVERNAVTDDPDPIPTGCEVIVVGTSGLTDLVVKRK